METIKTVGEIMISLDHYPWVYEDQNLKDAIVVIEKCKIDVDGRVSLPRVILVFNRDKELVGLVRRRDIFRGIEPKFLSNEPLSQRRNYFNVELDPNLLEMLSDRLIKGIIERSRQVTVGKIMRPVEAVISADDHLMKAIYEMVESNTSLLPVVKDGSVIGVARSVDVFQDIAEIILGDEYPKCAE